MRRDRKRKRKDSIGGKGKTYLLNISVTISISCSAAAIFSADEGCGLPNPNIDMMAVCMRFSLSFLEGCLSGLGLWCSMKVVKERL